MPRAPGADRLVLLRARTRRRRVEHRDLLVAVDEQRAARVVDLVARGEVHVPSASTTSSMRPGMDVDAGAPQDAAERAGGCREGATWLTQPCSRSRCAARDRARSSSSAAPAPRSASMSSFALSTTPSVSSIASGIERVPVERHERRHPVDRLRHAGHLVQLCGPQLLHHRRHLLGEPRRGAGHVRAHDRQLLLEGRIVNPLIQASALQRVVHFARAVGGEDDQRRLAWRARSRARES